MSIVSLSYNEPIPIPKERPPLSVNIVSETIRMQLFSSGRLDQYIYLVHSVIPKYHFYTLTSITNRTHRACSHLEQKWSANQLDPSCISSTFGRSKGKTHFKPTANGNNSNRQAYVCVTQGSLEMEIKKCRS